MVPLVLFYVGGTNTPDIGCIGKRNDSENEELK